MSSFGSGGLCTSDRALALLALDWAWRAGSSCHLRLSVFSSLTTIVVRHPVYFVVARICPKAIRKAPTLSVVLRPYALCYFLSLPSLSIPSPLSARRFAIHAGTRHTIVARTRPRTSAPPRSCISGVLKDPSRKDTPFNFVISLFTYQLHATFLGLFKTKTLQ